MEGVMCVCLDCEPVKCLSLASRPVGLGVLGPACAAPHGPFRDAGLVKDVARPAYWVPDHEILHCHSCRKEFSGSGSSSINGSPFLQLRGGDQAR